MATVRQIRGGLHREELRAVLAMALVVACFSCSAGDRGTGNEAQQGGTPGGGAQETRPQGGGPHAGGAPANGSQAGNAPGGQGHGGMASGNQCADGLEHLFIGTWHNATEKWERTFSADGSSVETEPTESGKVTYPCTWSVTGEARPSFENGWIL